MDNIMIINIKLGVLRLLNNSIKKLKVVLVR